MKVFDLSALRRFDLILIGLLFIGLGWLLTIPRTTDFIIFCIFVLAYDLLYGYMGRLSFGHMLYLGVGAYAAALSAQHLSANPFVALLLALVCGGLVGLLIGPIIVRTTGACFALINLAFNQVGFFMAVTAFSDWTGGEDGLSAFFDPVMGVNFGKPWVVFGLSLACLLAVVYLMKRLIASPFGILLRTIKENETRVQFLGYDTFRYKLVAFVISTAVAAFAGGLTIVNYVFVTPSFVDPGRNVEVIFACLIGGAASIYGALTGGVVFMIIANYLPNHIERWEMFLGFVLLLLVFRFRAGLWRYIAALFTRHLGKEAVL